MSITPWVQGPSQSPAQLITQPASTASARATNKRLNKVTRNSFSMVSPVEQRGRAQAERDGPTVR